MKILVMNTLAETFGSTVRVRLLTRCLREMGHNVLYSEAKPSSLKNELLIDQSDSLFGYYRATRARIELIRYNAPFDMVFLSKLNPLVVPLIRQVKKMKLPYVVDWDDLDSWFQTSALRTRLTRMVEKRWPRSIPVITTHNAELKKYAEELGCKKVLLVPQTVDTALFNPDLFERNEEKKRLGLQQQEPCVGIALTFTQGGARDFEVILKAFSRLQSDNVPLSLLIIGDGPQRTLFQEKAHNLGLRNVIWLGWVPYADIPAHLAACDLGIVFMTDDPGNHYRFSLKILEYMSMNIPIVGTITGATLKTLGHLLEPRIDTTVSSLADALGFWYKRYFDSNSSQNTQTTMFRDYAIRFHGMDTMKTSLQKVIDEVTIAGNK